MSTPSIMKTVTPIKSSPFSNTDSISEIHLSNENKFGIKHVMFYTFLLFTILILIYNSYLYFVEKTDILAKHFGIDISTYFQTAKIGAKSVLQGTKDSVDITKKNIDLSKGTKIHNINQISPIQKSSDNRKNKQKKLEKIKSESSYNSSFKKSQKNGGFCYIGTDKRHRHCIQMTDGDVCASDKIYPTIDICINPNLRPNL